jgi:hypothetical protein
MKIRKLATLILGTSVVGLTMAGHAQIVTNGSFEIPAENFYSGIKYSPSQVIVPGWTFANSGGLIPYGTFTITPPGQVGSQFAFLQHGSASMSQTISLPTNATGTYTLSYLVAGRHGDGTSFGNVTYSVQLDATNIVANARTTSDEPFTMQSVSFRAAPGSHVLTFTNAPNQLDNDDMEFFDAVQIVDGAAPPNLMTNGSFELPMVPTGSYEYSTNAGFAGNGWNYSANGAGVAFATAFNSENAEDGSQVVFLQNASAAVWQTVVLPAKGTYNLTYYYAGRFHPSFAPFSGNVTGTVSFDSTMLATNVTVSADTAEGPFTFNHVNSVMFTADAGPHVLMFSNSPSVESDNTMFLDNVQIVQVAPMAVAAYAGLQIHGSPGTNYTVESANALPVTVWTPLAGVIPTNDPAFFVDTNSAGIPGPRFYTCVATAPAQPAVLGIGVYTGYNVQGNAGGNYLLQYLDPSLSAGWTTLALINAPTSPFLWLDLNSHGQVKPGYYRAALLP